jgi:hypothetical protein
MPRARNPNNWARIERDIKLRADFRCECGTTYDCGSNKHHRRCPNIEGQRYPHNKRLIKLRIAQIGRPDDWRPNYLVALCLPCYLIWQQERARQDADTVGIQEDSLW